MYFFRFFLINTQTNTIAQLQVCYSALVTVVLYIFLPDATFSCQCSQPI